MFYGLLKVLDTGMLKLRHECIQVSLRIHQRRSYAKTRERWR